MARWSTGWSRSRRRAPRRPISYISGRYVLQPEIFGILEDQTPGAGGEVQLTDALIELMTTQEIRPLEFAGRTFDCGSPAGFVARQPAHGDGKARAGLGVARRARTLGLAGPPGWARRLPDRSLRSAAPPSVMSLGGERRRPCVPANCCASVAVAPGKARLAKGADHE